MGVYDAPYCLLNQAGRTHRATGDITYLKLLADLPRPVALPVISMVPYAQLRERGFAVHDDGEPIIALTATSYEEIDLASFTDGGADHLLPQAPGPTSDTSDEDSSGARGPTS